MPHHPLSWNWLTIFTFRHFWVLAKPEYRLQIWIINPFDELPATPTGQAVNTFKASATALMKDYQCAMDDRSVGSGTG